MADENTPITDMVVDTAAQDKQPDAVKTDATFREDTLGFIKGAQKGVADKGTEGTVAKDAVVETDGVVDYSRLAGTDIPDAFSEAAIASGMTSAEMIEYANAHTDAELLELVPALLEAAEPEDDVVIDKTDDEGHKDVDKTTDDEDKTNKLDPDVVAAITEKISKQLEEKFGATLKDIETFKAYQEEQSTHKMVEAVSKKFDEAFKEFPAFGKTEELPKFPSGKLAGQLVPTSPAVKARMEVLRYADAFMKMGANVDNAMDDALATYKGKHLTKELERTLIKDLKRHESKLSGARTGKETTKKYADTREEIIDEIRQLQKAHGLEP